MVSWAKKGLKHGMGIFIPLKNNFGCVGPFCSDLICQAYAPVCWAKEEAGLTGLTPQFPAEDADIRMEK